MGLIEKTDPAAITFRWFGNAWRACTDRSEPLPKRLLRIALALLVLGAIVAVVLSYTFRADPKGPQAPVRPPAPTGTP